MNTLFLQLSLQPDADAPVRAWRSRSDGLTFLGETPLDALATGHPGTPCVVFLPTAHCLLTHAVASARQLRQAGQALGWLIEEQTGEDVENLHVIAGPAEDEERTTLLAISRTLLQGTLDHLRRAGLQAVAVLPDLLLLPRDGQSWQLAEWPEGQVALRTGELAGVVMEADSLELLLTAAWQERESDIAFSLGVSAELRERVEAWLAQQGLSPDITEAQDAAAVLSAATDWTRHPANLLQGSFAVTKGMRLPKVWRIAAVFVAVAFSVQLLAEWAQYGYYRYQAKKTQAEAVALYKNLFPADRRIVNLERQLKAQLNGAGQGSNLLATLTRVAESLQGSGLNTQRIDFSGNTLTLDVNAQALGELDRFREKLDSQGFRTEIMSANAQGNTIRGRLRVEG